MKGITAIFLLLIFISDADAIHIYKEKDYQKVWCEKRGGILEYQLDDGTRVDCLLPDTAVEFDFAVKWAESIGQALYYGLKTNKHPAVVLIIESAKDMIFLERLSTVADRYNLIVLTISPKDILGGL